jgi:hemoglobin
MKKDIENIEDIKILVDQFYELVKTDPLIGHIFTIDINVNWERHLPVMYSFWENTLFYTGNYTGNPMAMHQRIHQMVNLNAQQFDRWTTLFTATVDYYFAGEKAELAKQRALSIATVMKIKLLHPNENAFDIKPGP